MQLASEALFCITGGREAGVQLASSTPLLTGTIHVLLDLTVTLNSPFLPQPPYLSLPALPALVSPCSEQSMLMNPGEFGWVIEGLSGPGELVSWRGRGL